MITFDYTLFFQIKGNTLPSVTYQVHLTEEEESNPLPRLEQECSKMEQILQEKTGRRFRHSDLKKIVTIWAESIQEGYRDTPLTLDLPIVQADELDKIQDDGYQELPDLIPPDIQDIEPTIGALPPLDF